MIRISVSDPKELFEFFESVVLFLTDKEAYCKTDRKYESESAKEWLSQEWSEGIRFNNKPIVYLEHDGSLRWTYHTFGGGLLHFVSEISIRYFVETNKPVVHLSGFWFPMIEDEIRDIFEQLKIPVEFVQ